jgi:transcriptional regulator with XRE-family HTH domain
MRPHLIVSGAAIREHRLRKGLSVQELADKAGLSYGGLYRMETKVRQPNMASVRKVAAALGIEIAELLREEPPPAAAVEGATVPAAP